MTAPESLGDGAQRALAAARDEAARLGTEAIGAEHILLGVFRTTPASGAIAGSLGLETAVIIERLEAGARRSRARAGTATEELAYTSHARRLVDVATREAREQGTAVQAEHLLLAAFREPRGTMARLLNEADIAPARARAEVLRVLGVAEPEVPARTPRATREPKESKEPARRESARRERESAGAARQRAPAAVPAAPAAGEPPPRRPLAHIEAAAARRSTAGALLRRLPLIAIPISLLLAYLQASPVAVFVAACVAVLPLAGFMGEATEHLAQRTGPTIGGLLNATFGNAAELIIAIVALRAGKIDLVKASITGSILGNLLLILGLSLIAASLGRPTVRFNRTAAGMSASMMVLAVVGLVFPALFHATHPARERLTELHLSEGVAVVLIVIYAFSLLFSLKTHKRLFGGEPHPTEGPTWSVGKAGAVLALATVGVAVESEILVHAVEAVTATLHISEIFLGLIVIPIIGNAAEHAAAVMVARKGQTDLALQIALGSSTQIALLVAPVLVFAGVLMGQNMNLVFQPFEVVALGLATGITAIITLDGESHWYEGVQLLAVYLLVAVAAFFI